MKILVSAFEPFDTDPENSSQLALMEAKAMLPDCRFIVLPVTFAGAWRALEKAIIAEAPSHVLALGQADSRKSITIERSALNWIDARIADNSGNQPVDEKVEECGDGALFSPLPVRKMTEALVAKGLLAEVSYTAGTFVCNQLFYELLFHAKRYGYKGGFVHLPLWREQKLGKGREAKRSPPELSVKDGGLAISVMVDVIIRGG